LIRRGRIDDTQREIVQALRKIGASVQSLADVGQGCPDLLVGYRGRNVLLELKGKASLKKHPPNGLTEAQCKWHALWQGMCFIASDAEEAIELVVRGPRYDGS